jgi:hypothetical protein
MEFSLAIPTMSPFLPSRSLAFTAGIIDVFLLARIHMSAPQITIAHFLEPAEGSTPVFGVIDTRDLPNVKFRINANTTAAHAAV